MTIYNVLSVKDNVSPTTKRDYFNGYLEDYLKNRNNYSEYEAFLQEVLKVSSDIKIITNLSLEINVKNVTNQIIKYRDAFKLPAYYLTIPVVLYWNKDGNEKAVLLNSNSYLEAKGLYFCMTEPGNEYEGSRNEVLSLYLGSDNRDEVLSAIQQLYVQKRTVGYLQRYYDKFYLGDVDEMKEKAVAESKACFEKAKQELEDVTDPGEYIYNVIAKTFLLKKAMYVQYMMSKDLLNNRHEGDIHKQRQFAKSYCEEIVFISNAEMWKIAKKK